MRMTRDETYWLVSDLTQKILSHIYSYDNNSCGFSVSLFWPVPDLNSNVQAKRKRKRRRRTKNKSLVSATSKVYDEPTLEPLLRPSLEAISWGSLHVHLVPHQPQIMLPKDLLLLRAVPCGALHPSNIRGSWSGWGKSPPPRERKEMEKKTSNYKRCMLHM